MEEQLIISLSARRARSRAADRRSPSASAARARDRASRSGRPHLHSHRTGRRHQPRARRAARVPRRHRSRRRYSPRSVTCEPFAATPDSRPKSRWSSRCCSAVSRCASRNSRRHSRSSSPSSWRSRTKVHDWIKNVLTDEEVRDGLLLAAAALVVLPLLPKQASIRGASSTCASCGRSRCSSWRSTAWATSRRVRSGAKVGLALAGLFSGFVSSTATIGAMGSRSKSAPGAASQRRRRRRGLVGRDGRAAGDRRRSGEHADARSAAAIARAVRSRSHCVCRALHSAQRPRDDAARISPPGRPFSPKTALLFVLVVGPRSRFPQRSRTGSAIKVCCSRRALPGWATRMQPPFPRRRSPRAARRKFRSQPSRCWSASVPTLSARQSWRSRSATGASLAAVAGNGVHGAGCLGRLVREILARMTHIHRLARRFPRSALSSLAPAADWAWNWRAPWGATAGSSGCSIATSSAWRK